MSVRCLIQNQITHGVFQSVCLNLFDRIKEKQNNILLLYESSLKRQLSTVVFALASSVGFENGLEKQVTVTFHTENGFADAYLRNDVVIVRIENLLMRALLRRFDRIHYFLSDLTELKLVTKSTVRSAVRAHPAAALITESPKGREHS